MILSFQFSTITVERKSQPTGNVRVQHNLNIDSVKERVLGGFGKQKSLEVAFTFRVAYEPSLGNIILTGSVVYGGDAATLLKVLKGWETTKKVPAEASREIVNTILTRCNIKSLGLAEDVSLPYHMPLPQITSSKPNYSDYIG